ncbi:hypothetical protein O181_061304 [Austropuccinia psidii MF-1]|uniref:Integrase catalytic domain-containing protein n=1 Tax=Austropuccinia psidii MF-1 TaxID=1389203 RepID=A0A9Q3I0F9_9BASI|nr:hypothetical protein [Austropuccinia psidii MF-1]
MKGITHEQSLPLYHKQNGVAERYNRSVANMGQTLLQGSGLGNQFWGYAFMWAAYTNNNIPNKKRAIQHPLSYCLVRSHNWRGQGYLARKRTSTSPKNIAKKTCHFTGILRKGNLSSNDVARLRTKMDVPFLLNNIRLGDFTKEETFAKQERTAENIIKPSDKILRGYKEAMSSDKREEWANAIDEELQDMRRMEVFEIAPLGDKHHIINGGWVFAKKIDNLSGRTRYKARYVAQGNRQYYDKEYKETFSPTATFSALRLLLTWAAKHKWLVHSFDFTTAYLNAPIDMDLWIKPPDGLNIPKGMGCRLKKALYGTKQAGRCWWEHLSSKLKALGFERSAFNSSVYFNTKDKGVTWIQVDNGIVIAQTREALERLRMGLEETFLIKWKDGVESLIGMEIQWHEVGFMLTQQRLIRNIVTASWDGKKLANTPLPPKQELRGKLTGTTCAGAGASALGITATPAWIPPPHPGPRPEDLSERRTHHGFVGCEFSRSTHGYLLMVHGCAVAWSSKRLTTVASSTSHAEYMALSLASRQDMWLKRLIHDVFNTTLNLLLQCNNELAIRVSNDSGSNKRTRHLDRDFYIVNEMLYNKEATLEWVSTKDMKADGLTKSLGPLLHKNFTSYFLT